MAEPPEQPLELILARNLISIISLAAILVDSQGTIVFYNDAAAEVIGARFEETGQIPQDRWRAELGPFDKHGEQLPREGLPVTLALDEARPGYAKFYIHAENGLVEVEAAALPLVGSAGHHGALVVFWPIEEGPPV